MNRVKWINWVYFFTVLISLIGGTIIEIVASIFGKSMMVRLLVSQFILIIPTLVYIIYNHLDIRETIRFRKIKLSNVIWLIIFAYLITPFMSLLNAISMLFSTNFITGEVNGIIDNNSLFLSVVVVALVPCILEESVYRGVFYNEYRKINPRKGIILSGLLFGFLHLNFNQFIYAFAMGMIFALLIEATDSIISSMIVHFVINGTSVVSSYMLPKLQSYVEKTTGQVQTVATATDLSFNEMLGVIVNYFVISIFTCILAFLVYKKIATNSGRYEAVKGIFSKKNINTQEDAVVEYNRRNSNAYYTENDVNYDEENTIVNVGKQRLLTIPLMVGILICLFIMVYSEIRIRL